ncbi:hypothetical protein EP47_00215 [Legionella norrlandica]|uniref:Uncharacterized protein n=1 Tax=Legionella norrlandica TaxID=1498499 RepID=A0A0A2SX56_9GAMM|nr:hypothetical protein [Legionella norrlandica]KGP64311.1 hypothetical protein EP47_00215 [Legionella norrlandica]
MTNNIQELQQVIADMAVLIEQNAEPDPQLYAFFFQHPEISFELITLINNLSEEWEYDGPPIYSACIFALDICIAQLQASAETNNKNAAKLLTQLMNHLAEVIGTHKHSLSFWLPVLNAFYEVHVELTDKLKDAYYELASQEDDAISSDEPFNHLDSIRDLIHELSDLSIFDIIENFFAQSYAMPPDFFADLILDLYSIDEGQDIALLTLLHPKAEIREIAVSTIDQLMKAIKLTSTSLTRLQIIKYWYPAHYHAVFDRWLKTQRKKGVTFDSEPVPAKMSIKATEVDGTGSQGVFIHGRKNKRNRLCGLLLKYDFGIKDAWITPEIPLTEVADYYSKAFDGSVTLRTVDFSYLQIMVEHFLAIMVEKGDMPSLHFLEMMEFLGVRFRPNKLDLDYLIEQLSVQIVPFTQQKIDESLKRSKSWLKTKQFTESWYIENPMVDKIVNHNSSFVDGVKVCRLADAMDAVFEEEMELNRDKWQFHFLWNALWVKAKHKKNEKVWQDSFLIAYAIHQGYPLKDIPVMKEICYQTVINSVETMQERRTHLSQE